MVEIRGRHIKILLYLLELNYPVSASKLCDELNLNVNTFRKDISQLKELSRDNCLSLVAKPRIGIMLQGSSQSKENLREKLNSISSKLLDRNGKIWYTTEIFLSKEKIPTIEDICELLDISRPTVVEYINEVKEWLSKREIRLYGKSGSGYRIEGREENIRDAIIESIRNFLGFEFQIVASEFAKGLVKHNLLGIFKDTNFHTIENFINEIQTEAKTKFTDEDKLIIALAIAISVRRIANNHKVTLDSKHINYVFSNKLSLLVKNGINKLEEVFQLKFTDSEVSYLALKFIGAKTQEVEGTKVFTVAPKFKQVAEEIVQLSNELLGLTVNKESEFISMLAHHLESTIGKIKMGAKIDNPAIDTIRKEYPIAYTIAERAARIIGEKFQVEVPNEEEGYIAMYIAASLEALKQPVRKKVAVICPMGIATSRLLYYKLTNEIPEIEIVQVGSIKELEEGNFTQKVDLIISTMPLSGVKIPHVVVSPFLRTEDKKLIKEILKIGKVAFINDTAEEGMFDERLIFPQISVNSSREVISILADALVKAGFAKDGLVEAVLARESKFPTGINADIPIAIPHAGPEFTVKKGFALATLKSPVSFKEMRNPENSLDVDIIIMPVLTGAEEDSKDLYGLLEKIRVKKIASELLEFSSSQEIEKALGKS
ncbi:MAG: BglG family transcription antiterminator [Caldisericaceae bacterium]